MISTPHIRYKSGKITLPDDTRSFVYLLNHISNKPVMHIAKWNYPLFAHISRYHSISFFDVEVLPKYILIPLQVILKNINEVKWLCCNIVWYKHKICMFLLCFCDIFTFSMHYLKKKEIKFMQHKTSFQFIEHNYKSKKINFV